MSLGMPCGRASVGYPRWAVDRKREVSGGFRPWRLRAGRPIDERRHELFALAAPVFQEHGYRGATIKAIAHACHLSPPGLYHYFRSKRALAIYPLDHPRLDWESVYVDQDLDPLAQIRDLIDLSMRELSTYLLALRLAEEIGGQPDPRLRARAFREGEAVFGRILLAVDPGIGRAAGAELAHHLLALLVGSAFTGLEPDSDATVRARMVDLLRRTLVPISVDADRFDRIMGKATATE
jgi:AcrR family transcriptional regulator